MAVLTVCPIAPPMDENMYWTARTTATYWWVVAAITAICSVMTRVPPAKAMKIWHITM